MSSFWQFFDSQMAIFRRVSRGGRDLVHFPGARRAICIHQSSFRSFLSIYIFFSLFVNGLPFYVKSNPLIQLLKPVISPVSPVTFDMLTSSCQQVCKIDDKQTCAFRGTTTVYVNNRHSQCQSYMGHTVKVCKQRQIYNIGPTVYMYVNNRQSQCQSYMGQTVKVCKINSRYMT